jgi:hypothetical protein
LSKSDADGIAITAIVIGAIVVIGTMATTAALVVIMAMGPEFT